MAFSMDSKTKKKLTNLQIQKICEYHFQNHPRQVEEIISGFYASIYKITLPELVIVLKIYPSDDMEILTYEKNIIQRELLVYSLMKQKKIPIPNVLAVNLDKNIIDSDYYITEFLEGDSLFHLESQGNSYPHLKRQIMIYLAQMHAILMDHFGYDNLPYYPNKMSESFLLMLQNVLDDGIRKNAIFPTDMMNIVEILPTLIDYLDDCKQPVLLHFDLWSGNVFVNKGKIVAIMDTERSFNGDPIADFSCMFINPFDDSNEDLIAVYNENAIQPIQKTKSTMVRYALYRFYLFCLMFVEGYYRGIDGSFNDQQNWCKEEFKHIWKELTVDVPSFPSK